MVRALSATKLASIRRRVWSSRYSSMAYSESSEVLVLCSYTTIPSKVGLYVTVKEVFQSQTVQLGERRVLLIDGHVFHVSVEFVECCLWAFFLSPPPLNVSTDTVGSPTPFLFVYRHISRIIFSRWTSHALNLQAIPIKDSWIKEIRLKWLIIKLDFLTLLKNVREEVMTLLNIMSAWEATGKLSDFDLYMAC